MYLFNKSIWRINMSKRTIQICHPSGDVSSSVEINTCPLNPENCSDFCVCGKPDGAIRIVNPDDARDMFDFNKTTKGATIRLIPLDGNYGGGLRVVHLDKYVNLTCPFFNIGKKSR